MPSITATLPGGIKVTGTRLPGQSIQYFITLADSTRVGPYTGDQFVSDMGTFSKTSPPPAVFRLSFSGTVVATSSDPADIQYGGELVLNAPNIRDYIERNLAVDPSGSVVPDTPDPAGDVVDNSAPIPTVGYDEFAGVDAAIAEQEVINAPPVVDEFEGIDEAIITQENMFPEPVLSDEEVNQILEDVDFTEPPDPDPIEYDEFAGVEEAVLGQQIDNLEADENPALTDEEVNLALDNVQLIEPPDPDPSEYDEFAGVDEAVLNEQITNLDIQDDVPDEDSDTDNDAPYSEGSSNGLTGNTEVTQGEATAQDNANFAAFEDWRVRLSLASNARYLYRAPEPGILAPLATTDGVVFPYTPLVSVNYAASYEPTTITHSNYKVFQYAHSSVDNVSITCDFTAQDTWEANYLLAVIHFFKSMTKMFYGQDELPRNGTPPPLCFLFGLGGFQFEAHPLAITNFSYNLPNDVDYIRTTTTTGSTAAYGNFLVSGNTRLPAGVRPGGTAARAEFGNTTQGFSPTYVPTKIQLAITCVPIISRNSISNRFSLEQYATGALLQGARNIGGGIW